MQSALVAGLAFLTSAAISSEGKSPIAVQKKCPDVLEYSNWQEAPNQVWDYRSPKLTIFGARHSRDPSHEQFARIKQVFAAAKPTVAFFEGPDRGIAMTAEEAIRTRGESGYLRFLAKQAGVATRTLEPSPAAQARALLTEFPVDQVFLFFVLRETTRLRDREGLSGDALEARTGEMLKKLAPMAAAAGATDFADTQALQKAFGRYWPARHWKTADARWFSPGADDHKTGGVFAARINRADSSNRDHHLVSLLSEAVTSGEKPFVVIGRNHVPMVSPALTCLLQN